MTAPPLQLGDPSGLLGAPGVVRGPVAFAVVLLIGGVILWRFESLVDRSIDASINRPLSSMGYGVAAHAVLGFVGIYLANQLGQVAVSGQSLMAVGLVVGLVAGAVAAGVGFTVVGSALVELGWERRRWHGLLVGALIAGGAGVVEPLLGGLVWLVVVSTGIGGPVRQWLHASAGPGR